MLIFTKAAKGRVRVTERLVKDRGDGYSTLLAREGEEISIQEAHRRGIPEDKLEPVGHAGEIALAALRKTNDADAAEAAAAAAHHATTSSSTVVRENAGAAVAEFEKDYPYHKGGGVYELSNGETVKGKDAAQEAEAALHTDTDSADADENEES